MAAQLRVDDMSCTSVLAPACSLDRSLYIARLTPERMQARRVALSQGSLPVMTMCTSLQNWIASTSCTERFHCADGLRPPVTTMPACKIQQCRNIPTPAVWTSYCRLGVRLKVLGCHCCRSFLVLWLMVLPWSFVQTLRWWTIGASAHTFRFPPMLHIIACCPPPSTGGCFQTGHS